MPVSPSLSLSFLMLLAAAPLSAQQADAPALVENVRLDYAQVLNVEPVYASPHARRTDTVCDDAPKAAKSAAGRKPPVQAQLEDEGRWSKAWGTVKGWFAGDEAKATHPAAPARPHCRAVSAADGQDPVAYDVDYMYKGMKYRSRLPEDPGNRLRIRISVAPYQPGMDKGD
jgi:uncharacterized protein YcfJ